MLRSQCNMTLVELPLNHDCTNKFMLNEIFHRHCSFRWRNFNPILIENLFRNWYLKFAVWLCLVKFRWTDPIGHQCSWYILFEPCNWKSIWCFNHGRTIEINEEAMLLKKLPLSVTVQPTIHLWSQRTRAAGEQDYPEIIKRLNKTDWKQKNF